QALVGAIQAPVDGASVAPFGISISKTGELEFDAEKFQAALAADPAKVEAAYAAISQRVADVADRYSDKYDGQLTKQIEGRQALIKDLDMQIESWTRRLDTREANLKRTYAALEVALSAMNAQSDYLQSQLAGLPTWNPQPSK
ncbi:MAG TPA: flagellar filament capping protein FliD, partial [Agromyces sp.]